MTDDRKVAQRYRELGAEEPPRALDDAILAAARREAGAGPASLEVPVVRSGRQRWYAPMATAAVLVLAVAVTLQMRFERPDIEAPQPMAASPDRSAAQSSPRETESDLKLRVDAQLRSAPAKAAQGSATARRAEAAAETDEPAAPAARAPQPFAANRAADAAGSGPARSSEARPADSIVIGSVERQREDRISRDAEAAAHAPRMAAVEALAKRAERAERSAAPAGAPAPQEAGVPERELERIAVLRTQGRHADADAALAEFRKRYPDFRIPAAMLERVERR
jgi:hypothetical protein